MGKTKNTKIKSKSRRPIEKTPHPEKLRRPPRLKSIVQKERIAKRHKKPKGYHRGHSHK